MAASIDPDDLVIEEIEDCPVTEPNPDMGSEGNQPPRRAPDPSADPPADPSAGLPAGQAAGFAAGATGKASKNPLYHLVHKTIFMENKKLEFVLQALLFIFSWIVAPVLVVILALDYVLIGVDVSLFYLLRPFQEHLQNILKNLKGVLGSLQSFIIVMSLALLVLSVLQLDPPVYKQVTQLLQQMFNFFNKKE